MTFLPNPADAFLFAGIEVHGNFQQEAGEAGAGPRTDWPELVTRIRAKLPEIDPDRLTSIGTAIAAWSAARYHLGRALAGGTETYDDGRRVGRCEAEAIRVHQDWTLALLAEFSRLPGEPEEGPTEDDWTWALQRSEAITSAEIHEGNEAATNMLMAAFRTAPTEQAAGALGLYLGHTAPHIRLPVM